MVSFLVSIALVGLGDLGVALTLCHASHSQIHTDLAALALEVSAQTINDLLRHALCLADAECGACAGKMDLAKKAKALNLDAIHDTVHEMAKDEARLGRGFEGLLKRYFNTEV